MNFGLERIKSLLVLLDDPQNKIPAIHIAGTNGKGSTCAFLVSILKTAGYRVGSFNSPHSIEPRDCIKINSQPISKELFDSIEFPSNECTEFEKLTAKAFVSFLQQKCDFIIIECGLGGLLDATNVIDCPLATVITSIGYDHINILGDTLDGITRHKCGIFRKNSIAIIAPQKYPTVLKSIKMHSEECKELLLVERRSDLSLSLLGDHQFDNSSTAIACLEHLNIQNLTASVITDGLMSTSWPGRLEYSKYSGHEILIDGAHNIDSADVLHQFISSLNCNIHWILGFTAGKDSLGFVKKLIRDKDDLSFTTFSQPESMPWISPQSDFSEICDKMNRKNIKQFSNLKECLDNVISFKDERLIVVTGSLYLISDFMRLTRCSN